MEYYHTEYVECHNQEKDEWSVWCEFWEYVRECVESFEVGEHCVPINWWMWPMMTDEPVQSIDKAIKKNSYFTISELTYEFSQISKNIFIWGCY